MRVTHPRLHRAFLRGVRYSEPDAAFVVQLGRFRGAIEVEDTPFFAVAYDADAGELWLSDGSREPLEADSLAFDPDGVLRCRVKGRFAARFTRAGQADLLGAVEPRGAGFAVRAGGGWLGAPGLQPS